MKVLAMQSLRLAFALLLIALAASLPAASGGMQSTAVDSNKVAIGGMQSIAVDSNKVAIGGYDAVAYFTDDKAVQGTSAYEYVWEDAKWRFASAEHRAMFVADPYRYMPQFGGYCASAMASGMLFPANPKVWIIVNGKLYILADSPDGVYRWKANADRYIGQAAVEYAKKLGQ
jgi:hypothetical protein